MLCLCVWAPEEGWGHMDTLGVSQVQIFLTPRLRGGFWCLHVSHGRTLETWEAQDTIPGLYTFQMYLYCVHF